MRKMLQNKKGFTLVELMIVIVIMGILVAVAIPVYGAVTKNAEKKTCASNVQTIKANMATLQMTGGADGTTYSWKTLSETFTGGTPVAGSAYEAYKKTFEGGNLPQCPTPDTKTNYLVTVTEDMAVNVVCPSGAEGHAGVTTTP